MFYLIMNHLSTNAAGGPQTLGLICDILLVGIVAGLILSHKKH